MQNLYFVIHLKYSKKKYGIVNEKSKFSVNSDYTRFRINAHHEMLKYKIKNNIKYKM